MAQREVSDAEIVQARSEGMRRLHQAEEMLEPDADPGMWWLHRRVLEDGRVLTLDNTLGWGWLRLGVSLESGNAWLETYYYESHRAAWRAALGWDGEGEPEGWWRHPQSGRRRHDGDPAREYIQW